MQGYFCNFSSPLNLISIYPDFKNTLHLHELEQKQKKKNQKFLHISFRSSSDFKNTLHLHELTQISRTLFIFISFRSS
ncbi:hypothetical protein Hanom_Chr13g01211031 [Helianthus anomalus]